MFDLLGASLSCQNVYFRCALPCPTDRRKVYTCFIKPGICFCISYLNLDTRSHMRSRGVAE